MSAQRILQIELNEFDPDFLRRAARALSLRNVARVLDYTHTTTTTHDRVEHQGLDPWVQWVNVHTGEASGAHGVRRLGDTRVQLSRGHRQIWQHVADSGGRFAVWGAMNAPLGGTDGCEAFMPDPWCYEETAHPAPLNDLLALPRYMSRNYLDTDRGEFLRGFGRFVRYYLPPARWGRALRFSAFAVPSMLRYGAGLHTLTTLLDWLSALEFAAVRRRARPDYSLIFLNHIAHLQHQFWENGDFAHPQMQLGLKTCDRILGLLLDTCMEGEAVVVLNGLRQTNVTRQGQFVYRQINPESCYQRLLPGHDVAVEPCMTNDATLSFGSSAQADAAQAALEAVRLDGARPLLFVERLSPLRVFAQLDIHDAVPDGAEVRWAGGACAFSELFELICERTGAHVPDGDVFADGLVFPAHMYNHEFAGHLLGQWSAETRAGASARPGLSSAAAAVPSAA